MIDTPTSNPEPVRYKRRNPAGALWLVQAFTGLLLVLLLLLHMVAHHFVVEGGLRSFQEVIAYVSNPAIFFTTLVFLLVVTVHATLGVRAIIMDLGINKGQQRILDWIIAIVTVATIIYGAWLEFAIINM